LNGSSFDFMIDITIIAWIFIANVTVYFGIHLPLDILTQVKNKNREKKGKNYPPWGEKKLFVKIITVIASLFFWAFICCWPILHFLHWDGFVIFFNYEIPYISTTLQYLGAVLTCWATIIACLGRISRSIYAISWGVPQQLTIKGGFRIVRHPLYASYCYYFLGLPLLFPNYFLLILLPGIYGYYRTAKYEEEILLEEFGEEYRNYQKKVGMLLPFIGRKKKSN